MVFIWKDFKRNLERVVQCNKHVGKVLKDIQGRFKERKCLEDYVKYRQGVLARMDVLISIELGRRVCLVITARKQPLHPNRLCPILALPNCERLARIHFKPFLFVQRVVGT